MWQLGFQLQSSVRAAASALNTEPSLPVHFSLKQGLRAPAWPQTYSKLTSALSMLELQA